MAIAAVDCVVAGIAANQIVACCAAEGFCRCACRGNGVGSGGDGYRESIRNTGRTAVGFAAGRSDRKIQRAGETAGRKQVQVIQVSAGQCPATITIVATCAQRGPAGNAGKPQCHAFRAVVIRQSGADWQLDHGAVAGAVTGTGEAGGREAQRRVFKVITTIEYQPAETVVTALCGVVREAAVTGKGRELAFRRVDQEGFTDARRSGHHQYRQIIVAAANLAWVVLAIGEGIVPGDA